MSKPPEELQLISAGITVVLGIVTLFAGIVFFVGVFAGMNNEAHATTISLQGGLTAVGSSVACACWRYVITSFYH